MTWCSGRRWGAGLVAIVMAVVPAIGSLDAASSAVDSPAAVDNLAVADRVSDLVTYCGATDLSLLGYDPFYRQHCKAQGLDVLASGSVDPAAVERAAEIIIAMIGHRQDLIDAMVAEGTRVAVTGIDEVTSDMPEYRDIYEVFPGVDWNVRVRGLGATPTMLLSSVGEENILCLPNDNYFGSSIMVHEFAHTILTMGLRFADPAYSDTTRTDPVVEAFVNAQIAGRWTNTWAATNPDEYWAETVMSYFDTNIDGPVGGDGLHNQIDTRVELAAYDPEIYAIIDDLFADAAPLELCNG